MYSNFKCVNFWQIIRVDSTREEEMQKKFMPNNTIALDNPLKYILNLLANQAEPTKIDSII